VVSFLHQPPYIREKALQYLLNRRRGGPQIQPGCCGKEKKIPSLLLPGIEPQ